jgi:hypothetical protein
MLRTHDGIQRIEFTQKSLRPYVQDAFGAASARVTPKAIDSPITNHLPIGHTNGSVARVFQAPSFILATPVAPSALAAMHIRTAATQGKRGRNHR